MCHFLGQFCFYINYVESCMNNNLVQNKVVATQNTSPENELASDHRHSTSGSTELGDEC